jgi:glycosyltransferase involved in cell wall biosynthesis
MKVLLCIDNLGSGGAQRQIVTLAIGLKKRGYEVDIFTYFPQNFFEHLLVEAGIKLISIPKKSKIGLNVLSNLRRILLTGNYDIAVSYLKTPNIYLVLAALSTGVKTKVITSERTRTNLDIQNLVLKIRYQTHMKADQVVFNSHHERNNWSEKFKRLKDKSMTIYNGIDTDRFTPSSSYAGKRSKILGIGSVGPDKNILCLIRAVHLLKQQGIIVNVTWYGQQSSTVPKYVNYLIKVKAEIEQLGITELWEWKAPVPDIESIFADYDFFVLPSLIEGLPNVVCESLASGLPVLVSKGLDHPLLVEDGERGLLFDSNDPADLAEKIKLFYSFDESKINTMKKNAREYAVNNLSVDLFIRRYEELFKHLLNK